ncbi:DNA-binding transcriptional regulator, ArsR family [Prosthecobacter debontii]|uniref:DNA-binding transcriptional regulator, ArsR family n=1 Tax=Prosthecobacter debontii TaxID=48467 RepID=A0A1T4XHR6_9BACT|nr:autorepressor SdpR family transcription factor [Prosthecobacter debontii]SKA89089.1 DNA-binding transcriptional regulator, ArsR family [Prosthecobacter debontii]
MNQLFKALNDPTRRQILELLKRGSLTAGEIAEACEVGKPTVSHHLDLLRQAELIEEERQGQFRRYHLNTSVVEDVMVWLRTLVETPRVAAKKAAAIKRLSPRTSNS